MTDNPDSTLRQDHAEGTAETEHEEHEEQRAGKCHDRLDACCKKLCKDCEAIKILERLSGRGPKLVDDAVRP